MFLELRIQHRKKVKYLAKLLVFFYFPFNILLKFEARRFFFTRWGLKIVLSCAPRQIFFVSAAADRAFEIRRYTPFTLPKNLEGFLWPRISGLNGSVQRCTRRIKVLDAKSYRKFSQGAVLRALGYLKHKASYYLTWPSLSLVLLKSF